MMKNTHHFYLLKLKAQKELMMALCCSMDIWINSHHLLDGMKDSLLINQK